VQLKAIRGVPWTLASVGASKAVNVLTTIVLARLVAPEDFGLVALATLALNLLAFVKDLGLGGTLIVRQDLDARALGTVFTLMVAVSVLLAILAVAVAPLLASFFDEPRLTGVLAAMAFLLLISGFSSFYEVLLQREMEFRRRFVALMIQSAIITAVSIPLAAAGAGVWSLVAGQVAGLAVFGVATFALSPYRVRPAFERSIVRGLFGAGTGFLLQNLAIFARQNTDYIVVGRAFGANTLGFYSMAFRLGDLTFWAIADPVARVTFPSFTRTRAEGGDVRGTFLTVLRLVALVSCPLGVLLSATAEPFTDAVFGERWLPMIGPLAVLGIWAAIRPVETTLNWLLNSVEQARVVGVFSVLVLVPLVPAFIVAGALGDITTVAYVVLGDVLVSLVFMSVMVARRGQVRYVDQWRSVAPVVIACLPAWALARGVSHWLDGAPAGVTLVAAVAAGAAVYLLALMVIAPGLLKDALRQIGRTLGREPAGDTPAEPLAAGP
jgi:O-antigen/teichoic acid export membrane protein